MRSALVIPFMAALASCRPAHADRTSDASATAAPQTFDEATVTAISHAMLDAHDRADEILFARAIGSSFVLLDEQRIREHDALLGVLRARRARGAPIVSRTYQDERAWIGITSAVYIGEAIEHYPQDGARPTGDFDGRSTIVWVREGGAWKAASWQWIKGGVGGCSPGMERNLSRGTGLQHPPESVSR